MSDSQDPGSKRGRGLTTLDELLASPSEDGSNNILGFFLIADEASNLFVDVVGIPSV